MLYKERIPKDIVKYVNKNVIQCIVLFSFLEIIAIVASVLLCGYITANTNKIFYIFVVIILSAIPFIVSRFPLKLIDKSWSGVVTDVIIKSETGTFTAGHCEAFPYDKNVIYLSVKKDNGREVRIKAQEYGIRSHPGFSVPNEGDVIKHLNDYSVGDKVYHFYGLKHNCIIKKNSELIECVVCGSQNSKERDNCLNCDHSLIKNL